MMKLEEAISKLKYELDKSKIVKKYQGKPEELFDDLDEYIKSIETVLNHLTKQEKKIKLMVEKYNDLKTTYLLQKDLFNDGFISKDKLKEKIEEYEKHCSGCEFIHLNLCEHCFYRDRIRLINELLKE